MVSRIGPPSRTPQRTAPKPRGPTPDDEDMTNFMKACARGDNHAITEFLTYWPHQTEIFWKDSHRTGLLMAALNGHESTVKLLCEHNANLYATDNEGCSALMMAVQSGNEKLVEFLLGKGFKAGAKDQHGRTPLHHYVTGDKERGGPGIPALLVKHGANIDDDTPGGFRPLHWAINTGRKIVFRTLLDLGADVTAPALFAAAAEQGDNYFLLQLQAEPSRREKAVEDAVSAGIGAALKISKPFNLSKEPRKKETKPPAAANGASGAGSFGWFQPRREGRSWTA